MKYTVVWAPKAEEELADLWVNSPDRADIASAADAIDAMLRARPTERGESRGGRRWDAARSLRRNPRAEGGSTVIKPLVPPRAHPTLVRLTRRVGANLKELPPCVAARGRREGCVILSPGGARGDRYQSWSSISSLSHMNEFA